MRAGKGAAVTGVLQRAGVEPDGNHWQCLIRGYEGIYGEWGHLVLERSLTKTREPDFAEAQLVGASEILAAGPGTPMPCRPRLQSRISKGYGNGVSR